MPTIGALVVALAISVGTLVRTQMEPDIGVGTAVATAPIGPAGGTLPFAPGAYLEVPPLAVDEQTVFTVRRFGTGAEGRVAAVLSVAGASYAFGPADLEFAVPVTIVFPLPQGPVPEVVLERGGRSTTVRAVVDRSEETISVRTRNFTDLEIAGS